MWNSNQWFSRNRCISNKAIPHLSAIFSLTTRVQHLTVFDCARFLPTPLLMRWMHQIFLCYWKTPVKCSTYIVCSCLKHLFETICAFGETCQFQLLQLLEFQEILQKISSETLWMISRKKTEFWQRELTCGEITKTISFKVGGRDFMWIRSGQMMKKI